MAVTIDGTDGISPLKASGQTQTTTGTAASPAISSSSDTDSGIFFGTNQVNISTGGSTRATVDSSGRLLVGKSSEANLSTLSLQGRSDGSANHPIIRMDIDNATPANGATLAKIFFGTSSDTSNTRAAEITVARDGGTWTANSSCPGRLLFFTTADGASSPTERVRIDKAGQLLCGTLGTTPNGVHRFQSNSTNDNEGALRVDNTDTAAAACAASFVTATNSTATSNALVKFGMNSYNSGQGQINANGASQAAFGTFSDERLKENITSLPSQWDNIKNLRPVEFDFIESQGGGHQIGFIAQEFETVYADAVGSSPMFTGSDEQSDEERLTITGWSKTEARLVRALQEAIDKIETLETQNADLLARVTALEAAE